MNLDSQACRACAGKLKSYSKISVFSDSLLQSRHNRIQNELASLSQFFTNLANWAEQTDQSLTTDAPFLDAVRTGLVTTGKVHGSFEKLFTGRSCTLTGSLGYGLVSCQSAFESKYLNASVSAGAVQAEAEAVVKGRLMKENEFDPELSIKASANAALGAVQASAYAGLKKLGVSATGKAEVGSVYAEAEATLNREEQTLKLSVGAAAVRGECEFALNIFGVMATVTLSGSLGSCEAEMEYSHKNREWEVGAKGGFIAGLGVKVNVKY